MGALGAWAVGAGRAALVGVDLDDPAKGAMHQVIAEGPRHPDPITSCWALHRSIAGDFPTHTFAVVANKRAKYLKWRVVMQGLVGADSDALSPDAYLAAAGKDS